MLFEKKISNYKCTENVFNENEIRIIDWIEKFIQSSYEKNIEIITGLKLYDRK